MLHNFLSLNVDTFPDLKDIEYSKHHLDFICKANLAMLLMRLEIHLIVISLMKQQVHFIDLFGWSFVIGELSTQKLLKSILVELGSLFKETLKMVSPFMPFISDYLYHKLSGTTLENGDSLMIMNFPKDIKKR